MSGQSKSIGELAQQALSSAQATIAQYSGKNEGAAAEGAASTPAKFEKLKEQATEAYEAARGRLDTYFEAEGKDPKETLAAGDPASKERLGKLREQAAGVYQAATDRIDAMLGESGKRTEQATKRGAAEVEVGQGAGRGVAGSERAAEGATGEAERSVTGAE